MITIYQLDLLVNGKPIQFAMKVDESLKVNNKIDDKIARKWQVRLKAIAENMFGKEKSNGTTT